jgi:hypothetical protein
MAQAKKKRKTKVRVKRKRVNALEHQWALEHDREFFEL